jgi:ketosteroid isomerase-like protein
MERSPEIEKLVREELQEAIQASDVAALERTLSRAEGSVLIGSDATEYTRNVDEMMQMVRDTLPAQSNMAFSVNDVRGYAEGEVGWFDSTGRFERDGQSVEVRMTGVAHKEDGRWRFVQAHASIGVPNERMFDPLFRQEAAMT